MQLRIVHDVSTRLFEILSKPFTVIIDTSPALTALLEKLIFGPPVTSPGFSRVRFQGITIEGDIRKIMAEPNQTGDATASFVNRHGMPVAVADPQWSSSDESVATVERDATNFLVGHITTIAEGDTVIVCRNPDPDNDPATDGALDITGALAVRPDGIAVGGTMTFGAFTDIAPTP